MIIPAERRNEFNADGSKKIFYSLEPELVRNITAAIMLSGSIGTMLTLMDQEPAKHTKRYKELEKTSQALNDLLQWYPKSLKYDLVKLGHEFYDVLNSRLDDLFKRGLVLEGESLQPSNRWHVGDVLANSCNHQMGVYEVTEQGYNVISGPAKLYSETNWPSDPYLTKLRCVYQAGTQGAEAWWTQQPCTAPTHDPRKKVVVTGGAKAKKILDQLLAPPTPLF